MDEKAAVLLLKQGNPGGLEYLVRHHQVRAIRAAYLITRDLPLAEEIVQEAFLRAFRSIRSFDSARPFAPWFMRSVLNAAVKVMRRSARWVQLDPDCDEAALVALESRVAGVEPQVESDDLSREVWAAMERLTPRQRAVVVQRYFLEMNEKEMAIEGGTAVGTIKWLLHAARERLRGLLAERSDE